MVQIGRELYKAPQTTTIEELCVAMNSGMSTSSCNGYGAARTTLLMNKQISVYNSFLLIHLCISLIYIGPIILTCLGAFLHDVTISLSMIVCAHEISLRLHDVFFHFYADAYDESN